MWLLAAWLLAAPSVAGQAVSANHPFPVFDATGFAHKPDLTKYGLERIMVLYPNFMWEGNKIPDATSLPDHSRITTFAQLANQTTGTVVIDIEHWPVVGEAATVAESVKKYETVLQWFKTSAPAVNARLIRCASYTGLLEGNSREGIAWICSVAKGRRQPGFDRSLRGWVISVGLYLL